VKRALVLAMSAALLLAACSDPDNGGGASGGSGGTGEEVELTVSAASSLTEAFGEIGDAF
jgi:ABC-type molybdate transport system substrate-binding protein